MKTAGNTNLKEERVGALVYVAHLILRLLTGMGVRQLSCVLLLWEGPIFAGQMTFIDINHWWRMPILTPILTGTSGFYSTQGKLSRFAYSMSTVYLPMENLKVAQITKGFVSRKEYGTRYYS